GSLTPLALGRTEIGPLNAPIGYAPTIVGKALYVDELIGAAFVLGAAATAVRVAARVDRGDHDCLGSRFETEIVQLQGWEVGEHRDDVVRHDPTERLGLVARCELTFPHAAVVL